MNLSEIQPLILSSSRFRRSDPVARGTRISIMSTDSEYINIANEAWTEAVSLAQLTHGWKEEKVDKVTGVIVESRKKDNGRNIYRCRANIDIPAKLLISAITDTDRVSEWNKTLTEAKVLKSLSSDVAITYHVNQ